MLKPIKVTLLGVMAATTTALAIPQANAYVANVDQQPEATEHAEKLLVTSRRRWFWRKKWICYRRPVVIYRRHRKIVKYKRHCRWRWVRVHRH
ncbi:hypothetical protein [Acaryochloris sp. IP29b_bin.148]|uniref:hypothetical protein n=1 Tax=Acaryochloris sp. IP29b_bin.148 TaxID=2969218 RepID=UPI00262A3C2F|nr:hypothetical protein [Acaryochloris sp. IP29b_bin.148]